jgi:hypothetical protein
MNMLQTIHRCARTSAHRTKACPFCGEDPPLAALPIAGRYVVACENDDCPSQPQTAGSTLAEAWAKWNYRPQVRA